MVETVWNYNIFATQQKNIWMENSSFSIFTRFSSYRFSSVSIMSGSTFRNKEIENNLSNFLKGKSYMSLNMELKIFMISKNV